MKGNSSSSETESGDGPSGGGTGFQRPSWQQGLGTGASPLGLPGSKSRLSQPPIYLYGCHMSFPGGYHTYYQRSLPLTWTVIPGK